MNTTKHLHIFKPGRQTAMSGVTLDFSESDLEASARAYDPAKHEAPIVIGHPKHDAPAYGWVKYAAICPSLGQSRFSRLSAATIGAAHAMLCSWPPNRFNGPRTAHTSKPAPKKTQITSDWVAIVTPALTK